MAARARSDAAGAARGALAGPVLERVGLQQMSRVEELQARLPAGVASIVAGDCAEVHD
ncbi:MAG: hypothetical protein ACHP93_07065 [Solirubrobacterales bacterium]